MVVAGGEYIDPTKSNMAPALDLIVERIPLTLMLAGMALLFALLISTPLGIFGGLVLASGIRRRKRHRCYWIEFEAGGLALLGAWDFAMMLGMFAARLRAGDFAPRALFEPLPPPGTYVLPYPIAVYGGLFALVCVHLWTLRRFKKGE